MDQFKWTILQQYLQNYHSKRFSITKLCEIAIGPILREPKRATKKVGPMAMSEFLIDSKRTKLISMLLSQIYKKKFFVPVSIVFVTVLIGIVFVEILFSFFSPQPSTYLYSYNDDAYVWNSSKSNLYVFLPNKNRMENFLYFNKNGEKSLHDYKFKPDSKNTFRVLVMGDSISFGWPENKGYVEFFHESLQKKYPNKKIEVINCSVIEANILNLYDIYKKRCSDYKDVDLLIVQTTILNRYSQYAILFGENSGKSSRELRAFSKMMSVDSRYNKKDFANFLTKVEEDEFGKPLIKLNSKEIKKLKKYYQPKIIGYHHLNFVRYIENRFLINKRMVRGFNVANVLTSLQKDEKKSFDNNIRNKEYLFFDESQFGRETALKIFDIWKKEVENAGGKILVINIPNNHGMLISPKNNNNYTSDNKNIKRSYTFSPNRLTIYEEYKKYLIDLKQLGISSIDYLDIMDDFDVNEIFYQPEIDMHPNKKGYSIISDYLTEFVEKNFIVPSEK